MPRYFVRQPNGLLAEFSTVVDDFTAYDMTEDQAVEHCRCPEMSEAQAREKVRRGVDDAPYTGGPGGPDEAPPGEGNANLARWHDSLETILRIHGWRRCLKRMQELGSISGSSPP